MDRPPFPPPSDPSPPDVDPASCALLGPPALLVQGGMTVFVLVSLLVKRQLEKSKRTKTVWAMDVSKQLTGQALVHASNLLISDQVAHHGNSDACASYLLNVLVDTTLGVFFIYVSLRACTYLAINVFHQSGCISGKYGRPPRLLYLAKQTALYLAALVTMKLLVLLIFVFTLPHVLLPAANWVLGWMTEWGKVVFVMAFFPLVMNVLQFCIIDSLIKAKADDSPAAASDPLLPKHVDDLSDSEDEDGAGGSARARRSSRYDRTDSLGGTTTSALALDADTEPGLLGQPHKRNSFQADGAIGGTARSSGSAGSLPRGRQFSATSGLAVPGSPLIEPATPGQNSTYGSTSNSPALMPQRLAAVPGKEEDMRQRGRSRSREERGERRRSSRRRSRSSRSRDPEAGRNAGDVLPPFELDGLEASSADAVADQVARILQQGNGSMGDIHRRNIPEATLKEARRSLSSDSGVDTRGRRKGDIATEDVSLDARLRTGSGHV